LAWKENLEKMRKGGIGTVLKIVIFFYSTAVQTVFSLLLCHDTCTQ